MILTIRGDRFYQDGNPVKLWGIRVASGTATAEATDRLVAELYRYKTNGVTAITVFYQGSSGGAQDPFSPDGQQIRPEHQVRMERILRECDRRGLVVLVGIFYQNAPFGLKDAAAVEQAVRTVTKVLRPFRNLVLNIANEQNSGGWSDTAAIFDFRDPQRILDLCRVVRSEDPERLVGGGGYDHGKNEIIGRSPAVDALLFDTVGPDRDPDSGKLYDRFVAAGVTGKPIVNVEIFGGWTKQFVPPGVYPEAAKQAHFRNVDAAASRLGLSVFLHSNPWFQGPSLGGHPLRFDLGGAGTAGDPGVRWYFDYVKKVVAAGEPP